MPGIRYILTREQIVEILGISRLPVGTKSERETKERKTSEWLERVLPTMTLISEEETK